MAETTERRSGNLPAALSSFVGRANELAEIRSLVASSRLVTVTGVGGVGKTRTALHAAEELRDAFPDGVWLVELSGLRDQQLLSHTVAGALRLHDQTSRPQIDVLADHVARRRMLLVLDTCEHLVDSCAILAEALLAAAPDLHILATSRRPLRVEGERVLTVPPMPCPDPERPRQEDLLSESMVLFAQRAMAADGGFALSQHNHLAAARLCHRLDGIPLAIELAAVWMRSLSVDLIVERMDQRFKLLSGGDRALPRHETLRTAIGWSHELCEPYERLLWSRLAVFADGFDLAAAQEVCADDRLPAQAIAGVLDSLVDKSILMREPGARFRLLDMLRVYGSDWLGELHEQERMRRRHRDHYLALAKAMEADWCGPDQVHWSARMNREHANLRAALEFCLTEPGEQRAALDLTAALYVFWVPSGLIREGRHYLERAIALADAPSPELTKTLSVAAKLVTTQGDLAATAALIARCRPDAERQGDRTALATMAYLSGALGTLTGDFDRALPLLEEAVELNKHGGDPGTGLMFALAVQGMTLSMRGEFDRAIALEEECRALCAACGEQWVRSFADYMQGLAELGRGDVGAAIAHAQASLRFKPLVNDVFGSALVLDLLAGATVSSQPQRAACLLGFAQQLWRTFGLPQVGSPDLTAAHDRCERQARDALGDDAFQLAHSRGRSFDFDAGIAYALGEAI